MTYEPVVGMKVQCLKSVTKKGYGRISKQGAFVGRASDPRYPEKGEVYTIRNVNPIDDDYVLLLFEEIDNSHLKDFIRDGLEPGFQARHFRPVKDEKPLKKRIPYAGAR